MLVSKDFCSANHLLNFWNSMHRNQFNLRMMVGEHSENFIRKRLPYCGDFSEIEYDTTKPIHSLEQSLCLRPRHQIFVAYLCQTHGHNRFGEIIIFRAA